MSHPVVDQVLSGHVEPRVRRTAVQGLLPIPREDQIELWACLRNDEDAEVRTACRESLAAVETEEWLALLPEVSFRQEFFEFAVRALSRREDLASALLLNRALPLSAHCHLAQTLGAALLDRVIDDQSRLLAHPEIVLALLQNPALNTSQVRRVFDLAEQFFREHPTIPTVLQQKFGLTIGHAGGAFHVEPVAPAVAPPAAAVPVEAPEAKPGAPVRPTAPQTPAAAEGGAEAEGEEGAEEETLPETEDIKTLYQQLLTMKIPEKISLAVKGNKEARLLLIRDSNKVVQEAVIDSPKITDGEVESFAKMRNLPEELLRKIARNGEWMKQLPIARALATNPKTPIGVALPLISRLTDFDLKNLLRDKNVSELVRREAKKIFDLRHSPKKVSFRKG